MWSSHFEFMNVIVSLAKNKNNNNNTCNNNMGGGEFLILFGIFTCTLAILLGIFIKGCYYIIIVGVVIIVVGVFIRRQQNTEGQATTSLPVQKLTRSTNEVNGPHNSNTIYTKIDYKSFTDTNGRYVLY